MAKTRALRRHHSARTLAKARKIAKGWSRGEPIDLEHLEHQAHRLHKNRKMCSCQMCRNPRHRYRKEITMAEIKAKTAFQEAVAEA
jgi:hypothetical protein